MAAITDAVGDTWGGLGDAEIVEQVVGGNTAIFELLMRRYNERVYRTARAITRDEREAEDVMQQTYLNAFANLHQFRGQAQFSTWLTRIAVNEALARVRRLRKYEPFDETASPVASFSTVAPADPERQAFTGELRVLLEGAIDRLPDGAREVFMLRDVEGLSTAESAAALNVSDDVIKTRLSRARAALRQTLYELAGANSTEAFRFLRPRCDRMVTAVLSQLNKRPLTTAERSSNHR